MNQLQKVCPKCKYHRTQCCQFRYQAGWTQEFLAARMQLLGCYISRDVIANIETRRSTVTDKRIAFFAMVFRVPLHWPFPRA